MLLGYWAVPFDTLYTQSLSPRHWFLNFVHSLKCVLSNFFLSIPNETWRFRWIRMDASRLISLYLFYKWVKSHLTLFNIIQVECIWEMSWIKQKASPRWRRDYGLWKTFKRLWLLLRLPEEPNLYSLKDIRGIKEQFAYRFMDKKSKCCWLCWQLSVQ